MSKVCKHRCQGYCFHVDVRYGRALDPPPATLIKIMKAKISPVKKGGKPDFQCTGQMYIELTNATANVGEVCEAVRRQWGSTYTVVSTEGLEIDDTDAILKVCVVSAVHIATS